VIQLFAPAVLQRGVSRQFRKSLFLLHLPQLHDALFDTFSPLFCQFLIQVLPHQPDA